MTVSFCWRSRTTLMRLVVLLGRLLLGLLLRRVWTGRPFIAQYSALLSLVSLM